MANVSINDFVEMQKRIAQKNSGEEPQKTGVGFFKLANDGDTAFVRFPYKDMSEFNLATVHPVRIDGKFRSVSCLREHFDKADKCPLCSMGLKPKYKFYIKLVQYTRDENGNVVAEPKLFERNTTYVSVINDILVEAKENGEDPTKLMCKITRHNGARPADTSYAIAPVRNQEMYNESVYPIDFTAFDNYEIVGNAAAAMTNEELAQAVAEGKIEDASVFGK